MRRTQKWITENFEKLVEDYACLAGRFRARKNSYVFEAKREFGWEPRDEGRTVMITKYLHEAMRRANYKILEDGGYYGWIEHLPGVWANASSLEECREELESVVADWLLLGLRLGHEIPPLGEIDLNAQVQMVGSE